MIALYHTIFLKPIFNALIGLYNLVCDVGIAIILLTLAVRLLILPVTLQSMKSQKALQALQPKLNALKEKYKTDKQGLAKATMELYKQEKVNPASSCLPLLIQLPVLIALFQIFRNGFDPTLLTYLYSFVPNPGNVNPIAFGFLDLAKGSLYLGFVAAVAQFIQTKITAPPPAPPSDKPDFAHIMQKQMLYLFPLLVLWWSYSLPAALTLYWTFLNIFGIVQDTIVNRIMKKKEKIDGTANQYGHTHTDK